MDTGDPRGAKGSGGPLREQEVIFGFRIEEVTPLEDLRCTAIRATHQKSGARVLHLHCDDRENLLALAFRTPPPDDTGLPHILEHSVLCGSRKYPVKDPFVELLKSSLATFLNAMTYPDKTVYPCASMVEKDFFNLADVYCDAVFHPILSELHFKQEGHHLEFLRPTEPSSPLIVKGVVYNEMKGIYSDLDGIIERTITRSICPDNAYGRDSGGDPDVIPTLTYEDLRDFHARYYHPSNSFIFLYGDIPTVKHLEFLERGYLGEYGRIQVDTSIPPQPRWTQPRRHTVPYPISPKEDLGKKAAVVLTFLTNDATEAIKTLSMSVLEYFLIGNAASPLRKALIDSKLGEELTHSGYANYQRDTFFTVGLKGTDPDKADAVQEVVMSTLEKLARDGLDQKKVEAAFHRMEIAAREIASQYPLHLMDRAYRCWIYDADPLYYLRLNRHLKELRRLWQKEESFFERQLRELILENPHYTLITFVPDRQYLTRKEKAFREKMESLKRTLSPDQIDRIMKDTQNLMSLQSSPNPPEAVETLPKLGLEDVPKEPFELPTERSKTDNIDLLHTGLFSNGISYLQMAFDLRGLDDSLVEYLPLFTEALCKMGAGPYDYAAMAEREAAFTGGTGATVLANGRVNDPNWYQPFLVVSSKAVDTNLDKMFEVLSDRVLRCDFTDLDRLKDVVLQGRVARRSQLIQNGSAFAVLQAARGLSPNAFLAERLSGITQVRFFDRLAKEFDALSEEVVQRLQDIHHFVLKKGLWAASFVGDRENLGRVKEYLKTIPMDERAEAERQPPPWNGQADVGAGLREAIVVPSEVAFVASAFPALPADHPYAPALLVLSVALSFGYLWERVRAKGGAYGVRASYHMLSGVYTFSSYRDPWIKETMDAYRGVFDYVRREMDLSTQAVERAVIGALKTLDYPVRPSQAAGVALGRFLSGETPEFRREFRSRVLSVKGEDLRRACEQVLKPAYRGACYCVISGRRQLSQANRRLGRKRFQVSEI